MGINCTMESEHKQILKEKRKEIMCNVTLEKIKPLLLKYKMFNKYMWEDIHSVSDVFDLLPTRGPSAFHNIIAILKNANYYEEAAILENIDSSTVNISSKLIYKMTSKPLGYCLIINNVTFKSKDIRFGSDVDCTSLKFFFEEIGFDILVERDLNAAEMYNCIEKFSKSDFRNVDSAIVIILSHGGLFNNEDGIYGTDGNIILKKHIVEFFSNIKCPQLKGKPKVFFFIACRGNNRDYGALKVFSSESADSISVETLPTFTDILIVHSSLPQNISIRDHEKGTWFCQDLISVLKENHSKYDIEMIIKMVNRKLTQRLSLKYRVTQAAHVENKAFNVLFLSRVSNT